MAGGLAVPITPLRGRSRETAAIDATLSDALGGRGGVVVIEGRAGFGKTRLLEEALSLAERAGLRSGLGRADVDDAAVSMSPLISACFGGASPLLRRDDLAVLRAVGADRYWLLLELEELLERAALEHPMLICLDDLHWADAGTVEALRSLPVRLAGVPIVWVAAYRAGQASSTLISGSYIGKPSASLVLQSYVFAAPMIFPAGFSGSRGTAATAASTATTFNIQKNNTIVGTMIFAASATTAMFAMSTATLFTTGDVLTVVAPATADASLANLAWTFTGFPQ